MGKSEDSARFTPGSLLYSLSYSLSAMKANPFRALSLALTLGLGISLLTSNIVWADTGVQVSVDNYLENHPFQLLIKTYADNDDQGSLAYDYLQNDPLVDTVMRIDSTLGFLWGTDYPDDFEYDMDDSQYSAGVKDCRVLLVNNEFLNVASKDFKYEGVFTLNEGDVLVSTQFVTYTKEVFTLNEGDVLVSTQFVTYTKDVFNLTLAIGDEIDLEILGRESLEIGDMDRYSVEGVRIVGVYHPKRLSTLTEQAFPSYMRASWNYTITRFPVLGLRDSVMILESSVPTGFINSERWFPAHSLIRADRTALLDNGPSKISQSVRILATRVEEQYDVEADGLEKSSNLQWVVNSYLNSVSYSMLNLPIFLLALVLSIFAADTFMAPRATEVGVLRSKG
ncbi:MAG: hypothetical protein ACW985_04695, partial [Candidatus Thorarchaeota archaeon]